MVTLRAFLAVTLALLLSALLPSAAGAGPYRVNDLRVLSGPSPFATGCPSALLDETRITGAEIEPAITVNPADPRNIIATWQQDVGRGASRSDLIATSRNGGRSWRRVTIPGLSACTGGSADSATDPWVSAGRGGAVYFSGAHLFLGSEPSLGANVASRSRDGGRSWSPVVTVASASPRVERAVVTADPARPGSAYLVWWDRDPALIPPLDGTLEFARTIDGGRTWSRPQTIDLAPPNGFDQSGEVLVLPNGDLLIVFARIEVLEDGTFLNTLFATRSEDRGLTWSPPVTAAAQQVQPFSDPESGVPLSNQDMTFHSATVAPDGTVYVAWDHPTSATSGTIEIAKSTDGGTSWTGPTPLAGVSAFAFEPAIAVDKHGTVGAIWYDHRNDRPGDGALTTDVWFAQSRDGGGSWRQTHVAGPFDLRAAPSPTGFPRLGEYQGLAGLRRGFAAVFTQAAPQARNGPTDIFFARIAPGDGDDEDDDR
jgi:hypothetical protein